MVIHVASTFYAFCQKLTALALRYQTEIEFVQYQMRSGRCNSAACVMDIPCLLTKGQLISECLFEKIIWTKIPTKNLIDSAQQV